MTTIPEEEQDLLQSVFPEIKSIASTSSSIVTFSIAHSILNGNFDITFANEKDVATGKLKLLVKLSGFDDDQINPGVSANYEVFVKKQWNKFLKETVYEFDEATMTFNLQDTSVSSPSENSSIPSSLFIEWLMTFMPIILNEFDPNINNNNSKSKSFGNDDDENNSDHAEMMSDDGEDEEQDAEDIEDWQVFFEKQHELKIQRQQKRQEEEETARKLGGKAPRGPFRTTDEKYFVLIHEYHHIYSSAKQKYMVEKAIDYDLQGIMLRGKPGRCIIEGTFEGVSTWSRLVKSLRWQRCTEVGIFDTFKETDEKAKWIFDSGFGYRKCESEAELKRMLLEDTTSETAVKFFTYAFPSVIHPTRTAS